MDVAGELRVLSEIEERPGFSSVEFRIPSFVFLPENKNKNYKSDSFEFYGERWHLYFCTKNLLLFNAHLSLYIIKEASPRECVVHFELLFKRSDGTLQNLKKLTYPFEAAEYHSSCYLNVLYKLDFVEDHATFILSFRIDGTNRVSLLKNTVDIAANSCPVNESPKLVEASTQTESDNSNSNPVHESLKLVEASAQTESDNCIYKLSSDLGQLLLNGENSDLTISVKGVKFCLHRGIVGARTPVFSAMLSHDMKEKATGIVCIDDCKPEVFQAFARFLYSGMVNELSTDIVFELFTLADKYRVDELKSACLEFIRRSVSVDTFCDVVKLALTYEHGELLGQATDFFAQNMVTILQTVKWMNYLSDHPIQANELMLKAVQKSISK